MVKRISFIGKLLYLFTALFPLYLFWTYFFINRINFGTLNKIRDILSYQEFYFGIIFLFFVILSPIVFFSLIKNKEKADGEVFIKNSRKSSKHIKYALIAIIPFLNFLLEP